MMALWLAGVKQGDEVITTPFTAIATYAAICHLGARPVFVDIERDTFLMDLDQVKSKISGLTKAVVAVHLFGNALDIGRLRSIVGSRIAIIEDCAQAHGATVRGRKVGSLGDFGAFSFYPTKNLGGYGDGGLLVMQNREAADKAKKRRMYGMIDNDNFIFDGINTRLDELQAAILRVKLRYLTAMNRRRKELAEVYCQNLPSQFMEMQAVRPGVGSVHHVFCVLCRTRRDELLRFLEEECKIQAKVFYPKPLYKQAGYVSQYGRHPALSNVENVADRIIALPFYPEMTEKTVRIVARAINAFIGK
jgi:dTDP-4-amino-4,6-dideoxygalactose transaminase